MATRNIYQETRAELTHVSDPELAGAVNGLTHALASCEDFDAETAAVCRELREGRGRAAMDETAARRARFTRGGGPNPAGRWAGAWRRHSDDVRMRADIVHRFEAARWPIVKQGREWDAACFVCGGNDRLRIMPGRDAAGRPPHAWCRRCGEWMDAIKVLRNFQTGLGFCDAVSQLARSLGIEPPSAAFASDDRDARLMPVRPLPPRRASRHQ
ncbi:MAG: hypothetical protein ACR2OO_09525 [Thermomicrobiales bacterium]